MKSFPALMSTTEAQNKPCRLSTSTGPQQNGPAQLQSGQQFCCVPVVYQHRRQARLPSESDRIPTEGDRKKCVVIQLREQWQYVKIAIKAMKITQAMSRRAAANVCQRTLQSHYRCVITWLPRLSRIYSNHYSNQYYNQYSKQY